MYVIFHFPPSPRSQTAPQIWSEADEGRVLQPAPFRPLATLVEDGTVLRQSAKQLLVRSLSNRWDADEAKEKKETTQATWRPS